MMTEKEKLRGEIKRNGFSPVDNDRIERRNCKTQIIVGRDGGLRERVALQAVSPEHREQLILLHYLRNYAHCFSEEPIGVDVLSHDAPWDFDIALSNGERFFVEITAIADGQFQFEREKREERLRAASARPKIRVRDLRKLSAMFDHSTAEEAVLRHLDTLPDIEVENPFNPDGARLLTGMVQPATRSLSDQIIEALKGKLGKRHSGKDKTVVILDFRGNYPDQAELQTAIELTSPTLEQMPFPEIWFYVGYFSDDDGNNAEFSVSPLKLGALKFQQLNKLVKSKGLDRFGRLIF